MSDMIHWKMLTHPRQIDEVITLSKQKPCVIFKHSTRCSVSAVAKYRLDSDWNFAEREVDVFLVDVIAHRDLSQQIASKLGVYHESPQLLLIRDGECVYDASHLDISVADLRECRECFEFLTQ
ncbi:MAG: bacillithiol system redox-active protein YtxJ [Saprospiraceae bacterium]